LLWNCRA